MDVIKKMTNAGFTEAQAVTLVDVLNNRLASIPTKEEWRAALDTSFSRLEVRLVLWMLAIGTFYGCITIAAIVFILVDKLA